MESVRQRRRTYAQNFLRDPGLVERLLDLSSIGPADVVYEIGPGRGIITAALRWRCQRVVAVEKDHDLCPDLLRRFADAASVVVRCGDFLDQPLPRRPYKVFANIPFNATAAIVRKLVGAPVPPLDAYLVMQREAADRLMGMPSETLYALLLKPWFDPTVVYRFRSEDFEPAPSVEVVLLRLRQRGRPLVQPWLVRPYRDFVTTCCTGGRRTVREAVGQLLGRRLAAGLVADARIERASRPSQVPFDRWMDLFQRVSTCSDAGGLPHLRGARAARPRRS